MKKKLNAFGKKIFAGSLMLALAAAAFAESPVSTASQSLFSNDVDDVMSVTDFYTVEFSKFIASAQASSSSVYQADGAFKIKDILIAGGYEGSIFASETKSEAGGTWTYTLDSNTGKVVKTVKNGTLKTTGTRTGAYNSFTALVGFGNIGVKAKMFFSNNDAHGSYDNSFATAQDSVTTVTDDKGNVITTASTTYDHKGYQKYHSIVPRIEAGMTLDIAGMKLQPIVGFAAYIDTENNYSKKSVLQNGGTTWSTVDVTKGEVADSVFDLDPTVGATLTIPTKYVSNIIGLSYTGEFNIFNSKYVDAFGNSRKASANGIVTTTIVPKNYDPATFNPLTSYTGEKVTVTTAGTTDQKDIKNNLAIGYTAKSDISDKLTLVGNISANVRIVSTSKTEWTETTTKDFFKRVDGTTRTVETTTISAKNAESASGFDVSPNITFGLKYVVIPSKFNFLVSAQAALPSFTYKNEVAPHQVATSVTTTKTTDFDGSVTESKTYGTTPTGGNLGTVTKTAEWKKLSAPSVKMGFQWFMTENFEFDTSLNVSMSNGLFNGRVTVAGALKF
ncbi:hypothetical protein [Treponema sp. Marseille-Q3903]|uniref:TDE2508 family outer membrane beta-barrel protein n=1 Tax=Treponema sp. Marseille-Q3903 TaxID=2766703 RepID=UPI00165239AB|nr:hypothetical protein [Treponema sp. Marseille-Q3903]MBC6713117.1 hypothetical protein [Treponema sp. Marseille-Q3903]